MFKSLLTRARKAARDHLPPEVSEAGRKLRDTVVEHAPDAIADVVKEYVPTPDAEETDAKQTAAKPTEPNTTEPNITEPNTTEPKTTEQAEPQASPDAGKSPEATAASPSEAQPDTGAEPDAAERESAEAVLARVQTKADKGLKAEDSVVVVYTTSEFAEDAAAIKVTLAGVDTSAREIDLDRERPQVRRQLAELTGAMVPPYVYINGRYWGTRYDLESLAGSGDLRLVIANRIDEISDDARRIGNVRDSYSDEISVDNILARWRLGHILCADDLDAWFEVDKDGVERFFYQGGPQDVATMPDAAQEIVTAVEAEEYEASWQLEPSVGLP